MTQITFLLITANVGTLFNDESLIIQGNYLEEIKNVIEKHNPSLVALHMQEIGGKNYKKYMKRVDSFIQLLYVWSSANSYKNGRAFVDDDFEAKKTFTALGNVYLIHDRLKNIKLYNFLTQSYMPVSGFLLYKNKSLNAIGAVHKEQLYSIDFGADFKSTRKGFMRTRWNINQTDVDLVNVHLFHDADNIVATQSSPSVYSGYRKKAFQRCLNKIQENDTDEIPKFLFADFNFRLDGKRLLDNLVNNSKRFKTKDVESMETVEYKDLITNETLVTMQSKFFNATNEVEFQANNFKQFDTELEGLSQLHEFDVTFPPTYPFSEELDESNVYDNTRIPAWCDRVLMNGQAWNRIERSHLVEYGCLGKNLSMGDHKPVYLHFGFQL